MRCCPSAAGRAFTLFTLAILSAQSFTLVYAQSSSSVSAPPISIPSATPPIAPTDSASASVPHQRAPLGHPGPVFFCNTVNHPGCHLVQCGALLRTVLCALRRVVVLRCTVVVLCDTLFDFCKQLVCGRHLVFGPTFDSTLIATSINAPVPYAPPVTSTSYYDPLGPSSSDSGISTGFFANKAAVAGVFTVLGLLGVGAVLAVVLRIVRRRNRQYDDEDTTYFGGGMNGGEKFNDSGNNADDNASINELVTSAGPGSYPDRASHYGMPAFADDAQPRDSIVEYAKGTAYAAARAQAGPYQYSAQGGAYGGDFTNAHYQAPATAEYGAYPVAADPYSIARAAAGQHGQHPYAHPGDTYLVDAH
ncbi:predicted protein [Postia placenta Mad-698-R]|nr:predicted protein [Postia placenta Mad-698-R]